MVNIGDWAAIDECLYSCRNALSFKVFNPNKPGKYGLLFKCLNEIQFPYTFRSEPPVYIAHFLFALLLRDVRGFKCLL